ncbi:hypothetical protein G6F68_019791 [Rhizopus microsporus]|nr:hypothetical protein G6F68_019791 [Rhizopus microsporus]
MAATMPETARVYPVVASARVSGGSGTPRSFTGSGGAMSGRSLATRITYSMYNTASMIPGNSAPAYSCTTDTPVVAPYTISTTDGGSRMPRQPPAVMAPAVSRTL